MTLTDSELEARLRDLRFDTPAVPGNLAERTRVRHRTQRRRRRALGAGALVAAVVLVGVTLVAGDLRADHRGAPAAPPSHSAPATTDLPSLYEMPARGSLAGDDAWLDALAAREWTTAVDTAFSPPGAPPEAPAESHRVAFAGDVPSGRVALVLGLEGRSRLSHVWFTGPRGATSEQMTQATRPSESGLYHPLTLVDAMSRDAGSLTFVVVALPGDTADVGSPVVVDASGEVHRDRTAVTMEDNGVFVDEVHGTRAVLWPTVDVRVRRGSGTELDMLTEWSARFGPLTVPEGLPADPRGLIGAADRSMLSTVTAPHLLDYGVTVDQVEATLLAAGPLDTANGDYGDLIGATFPSGATLAWIMTSSPERPDDGFTLWELPTAPSGTALMDRVFAVRVLGGLIVSAPSGVSAQAVDAGGTVLATVPLRNGGGAGPLTGAGAATGVRILDAAGGIVAEAPITEPIR